MHLKGGRFRMGSDSADISRYPARYPGLPRELFLQETPAHEVRIRAFDLDSTEVTVAAFAAFVRENPGWRRSAIAATISNGKYLSSWSGDTPPAESDSLPVTFVTWYAATAYCESVGKRLPSEAEWEFAALGGQRGDSDRDTGAVVSPRAILALDPAALRSARGRHVIRGGSYDGCVVNLRARYRDSHPAEGAEAFVGFRCARD
jgi:formylglycine-generating enzyme required for sulfatase activity